MTIIIADVVHLHLKLQVRLRLLLLRICTLILVGGILLARLHHNHFLMHRLVFDLLEIVQLVMLLLPRLLSSLTLQALLPFLFLWRPQLLLGRRIFIHVFVLCLQLDTNVILHIVEG